MTYIDYMNQFWRVASVHPIPASEVAMYAFLVNECNARYWNMPVPCPTYYICESLRLSKQTVMTARRHLAEKGLIKFDSGKSRFLPSNYYLLELMVDLTHGLTLNNKDKDKDYIKPQTQILTMIQLPSKIDVGQLKSILLQRRIMKPRFRLPMSAELAYDCLFAATMAEVEFRHRIFCENDDVKVQLLQMANWLTSDNSKFGILFCGGCGNGKSTLLKAFQQLLNYLAIPNPDSQGNYGIQITDSKYVAYLGRTDYPAFIKFSQKDMLGIDDLGTEPQEVMDFGNVLTPVIDLLTKRYEEQLFTIITTNLTPKQIREHYGDRIADRLNEMVEKIVFTNGTYRADKS